MFTIVPALRRGVKKGAGAHGAACTGQICTGRQSTRRGNVPTATRRDYCDHCRTELDGPERHVVLFVIWLIAAAALGVAEMLTTTLALGLMAISALAAAATEAAGGNVLLQLAVFVAASVAGIVLIRPIALRRLHRRTNLRTGTAALVGQTGYVLADVTPHAGRVKIGGEEWSARPYDEASVIPAGSTVDVLQIKGATALVHQRE